MILTSERFTQFDIDRIRKHVSGVPTETLRQWADRLHDMQPNSHYHADCIDFELAEIGRIIERRALQDLELERKRYEKQLAEHNARQALLSEEREVIAEINRTSCITPHFVEHRGPDAYLLERLDRIRRALADTQTVEVEHDQRR